MGKFRICLVVTDAISFNVLYRSQLEYLKAQGFRLTLICGGGAAEIDKLRTRDVGHVLDLGLVRNPSPRVDLVTLFRLLRHFAANRYDLVLYTTPKALLLASLAACLTLQKRRIAFFQGRVYENYQGLKRKVFRLFDRITLHCSQEALFVSQSLMNEFAIEIPAVTRKGTVLGSGSANGVPVETFSPAAVSADHLATLRSDLGIEPEDFVVTIVGRINPDKGISEVAQVIRRVGIHDKRKRRIRFLFIGRVEGAEAQGQLDRLIRDGSAIHVDFTPDIAVYMALADVHLFLSHREGFGNVAIEAAAMGIPTVAFDVVGIRDSVLEGISGWRFAFGDTDAVSAKLAELASGDGAEQSLQDTARSWAVENFAQEQVWQRYADFYLSEDANVAVKAGRKQATR